MALFVNVLMIRIIQTELSFEKLNTTPSGDFSWYVSTKALTSSITSIELASPVLETENVIEGC